MTQVTLHNERVKLAPISQNFGLIPWASQGPRGQKGHCSELPHHPSLSGQVVVLPRVNVLNHIRELPAMHHPHIG